LVTGEVPDTVELEKLPAWLRPVIQRCIKNKPEERYFSAEELSLAGRAACATINIPILLSLT